MQRMIDSIKLSFVKLLALLMRNHYHDLRLRWGAEMADLPDKTSKASYELGHRAQRILMLAEKEFSGASVATTRSEAGERLLAGKRYAQEAKAFMRVAYDTNEYSQIIGLIRTVDARQRTFNER